MESVNQESANRTVKQEITLTGDTFQIELEFRSVGFEERRKPAYPEKNLSEQGREPTTTSIHI